MKEGGRYEGEGGYEDEGGFIRLDGGGVLNAAEGRMLVDAP